LREFVPHAANLRRNRKAISAAVVISSPFFAARNGEYLAMEEERAAASRPSLTHENGHPSGSWTTLSDFLSLPSDDATATERPD